MNTHPIRSTHSREAVDMVKCFPFDIRVRGQQSTCRRQCVCIDKARRLHYLAAIHPC